MYCNYCGKTIPEDANLCAYCGKRVAGMIARERLVRPRQNRKIAGVCLGFAEFFGLDVTLVRIVWAICSICGGLGAAAYGVAWIIMPEEPLMLTEAAPAAQNQMINT
jgi:phage shock protein C